MKKITFHILTMGLLLMSGLFASGTARAQALKTSLDTKVVMTDSLHLPANTSVEHALSLLPEILQRPGNSILSDYDIMVEDMSLGDMSDNAIAQLQLTDIERIEITESPISTYQNNGQGGCINLVLRSSGREKANLWGSVGVSAYAPLDVQPQFTIGYRSNKFSVRGLALGDIYNYGSDTRTDTYTADAHTSSTTSDEYRLRGQLARAYMQFTPNDRNKVKFNVSSAYTYSNDRLSSAHSLLSEDTRKANTLQTMLHYTFTARRFTLNAEMQYAYKPNSTDFDNQAHAFRSDFTTHSVSGKVEMKASLLAPDRTARLFLFAGCNGNGVFKDESTLSQDQWMQVPARYDADHRTHYLMPYLKLESSVGKVHLMAVGEFQHYAYHINFGDTPCEKTSNDLTAKFIGEYHFSAHHNLRVILDRKLARPTEEQLYPQMRYNPQGENYVLGDINLRPMLTHEASLDYISDYRWNEHSLQLDMSAGYNHTGDIVEAYTVGGNGPLPGGGGTGLPVGLTQEYRSFRNGPTSDIAFANFMAIYAYRIFHVSLTANVYNNHQHRDGQTDRYTYYNLSLRPSLQFRSGWMGSVRLTYHSRVDRSESPLGHLALAIMSIGKRWDLSSGHSLSAYAYGRVSLTGKTKDKTFDGTTYTIRAYELCQNSVGAGVKYCF